MTLGEVLLAAAYLLGAGYVVYYCIASTVRDVRRWRRRRVRALGVGLLRAAQAMQAMQDARKEAGRE